MITVQQIKNKLRESNCNILEISSSYEDLNKVMELLNIEIVDMIEIGTHNGLSSTIFTNYARRVFTFDVCLRNSEFVWNLLGVRNKISSFVGSVPNIEWELGYLQRELPYRKVDHNFNFAFVDGSHDYDWVKHDFELVKFCKRVLFHDIAICPGVNRFCKEYNIQQIEDYNFGYWRADEE
jgi:predicted O-methyltransferase YrrM